MQTGRKLKRPSSKQQKKVQDIRSGRTGNGFGRGMKKYNGQQKKRKLATENIYKTKQWSTIQNIKDTEQD